MAREPLHEQVSRTDAIRAVFDDYEKDEKVKDVLDGILRFFDWCSHVRNSIIRAQQYPALFGSTSEPYKFLTLADHPFD
jgi:hypothetical protein